MRTSSVNPIYLYQVLALASRLEALTSSCLSRPIAYFYKIPTKEDGAAQTQIMLKNFPDLRYSDP
jgi:hypothetical protein